MWAGATTASHSTSPSCGRSQKAMFMEFTVQSVQFSVARQCHTSEKPVLITVSEVSRFITECMVNVGTPKGHAGQLSDVLVAADYSGHYSHGLNRLQLYVKDVSTGMCDASAIPFVLKDTAATAWVDGKNGLGPVIGNYSMALAIEKAKEAGIGWVVATNSNHYGIAGHYSRQAMDQDLIGMCFTNTSPFLAPTRSKTAALGTNPVSVAAKGNTDTDPFVLDMATTAVAVGKIELQKHKGEPIPEGWALDTTGNMTRDAKAAMAAGCLMPVGGAEVTSGYKGYGLAVMVELFCGILGGGTFGPTIRKWMVATTPAKLSQAFVALDPSCFAPGFKSRLSEFLRTLRSLDPVDPSKPVLVAGDPEAAHRHQVDTVGGIYYHRKQIEFSRQMALKLGVDPMKALALMK